MVAVAFVARVGRLAWRVGEQPVELVAGVGGGEVGPIGLRSVRCAPHDRAAGRPPSGVLDVRPPEALLVAAVGVAPQRVLRALAAASLDLQVARRAYFARPLLRHCDTRSGHLWNPNVELEYPQRHGRHAKLGLPIGWARQDSNLDLTDYESAALTIEL